VTQVEQTSFASLEYAGKKRKTRREKFLGEMQQWYSLSDEGLEDAIYDSQAMREFIGIDLAREQVPDATTLLKFRRLLEQHELTKAIFEATQRASWGARTADARGYAGRRDDHRGTEFHEEPGRRARL